MPQRMLFLLRDGALRQRFQIAVGRSGWRTPIGPFGVIAREEHPTWDVPVSIQQETRRNPLGDSGIATHIDWTAAADVLRRRDGVA